MKIDLNDEEVREAFQVFDYDGSGAMSFEEFKNVIEGKRVNENVNFAKLIKLKEKKRFKSKFN